MIAPKNPKPVDPAEAAQLAAGLIHYARSKIAQPYENEASGKQLATVLTNWEAQGFPRIVYRLAKYRVADGTLRAMLSNARSWLRGSGNPEYMRLANLVEIQKVPGGYMLAQKSTAQLTLLDYDIEVPDVDPLDIIKSDFSTFLGTADLPKDSIFRRPETGASRIDLTLDDIRWFEERLAQIEGFEGVFTKDLIMVVKV